MKKLIPFLFVAVMLISTGCSKSPKSITLNTTTLNVSTGETFELLATISPTNVEKGIEWQIIQDAEVVDYDASKVDPSISSLTRQFIGKAEGTAMIQATTLNGLSAECTVTVVISQQEKDKEAKELLDKGNAFLDYYFSNDGGVVDIAAAESDAEKAIATYQQIKEDTSYYQDAQEAIKNAEEWISDEKAFDAAEQKRIADAKKPKTVFYTYLGNEIKEMTDMTLVSAAYTRVWTQLTLLGINPMDVRTMVDTDNNLRGASDKIYDALKTYVSKYDIETCLLTLECADKQYPSLLWANPSSPWSSSKDILKWIKNN